MSDDDDWKAAWSHVVDRIGESAGDGSISWAADRVERGAVRRYLEPLEFDCALHYSTEVAQAHGYADVIAPYTSVFSFSGGPQWEPGTVAFPSADRNAGPQRTVIDADEYPDGATGLFATDFEVTYHRPLVVGERVGGRGRVTTDVSLKETRVGRGAFVKFESTLVDETEEPVATLRTGLFVYEPKPTGGNAAQASSEMPSIPVPNELSAGAAAPSVGGQRTGADITAGELIEPVAFPLPVLRLVMEAGANRDFNLIHHNTEAAQAGGAPEMYANTLFLQAMWERAVRDFVGNAGTIEQISGFQMLSFNTAGDTATARGKVQSCNDDERNDDRSVVKLLVWTEHSGGLSVGPGVVTATVPRR